MGETSTSQAAPSAQPRRRRWLRWGLVIAVLSGLMWTTRPLVRNLVLTQVRTAIDQRHHEGALSWLRFAAALGDDDAEWHFLSARVHRRLEHFGRVQEHLQRADELGWNTRDLEREQWLALAQTGQFAGMSEHFPELFLNAGSDGPEISSTFVLMLLSQFRLQPALEVLDAWEKDFPDDPQPHVLRGRVLTVVRNWKEAEREYREALKLAPNDNQIRFQLAKCLMEQLQFSEAETELRRCFEEKARNIPAVVELAACLRKRQRHDDARRLLKTHWDLVKDDRFALREMGQIELAAERPESAVTYLKRAAKLNPVDRETRYAYAQALRAAGRSAEAQQELAFVNEATKPVLKLGKLVPKLIDEPNNIALRFEIANITWKYKSRIEGAKWYHSLLGFDPHHAATHQALAEHYELSGDRQRAAFHRQSANNQPGR